LELRDIFLGPYAWLRNNFLGPHALCAEGYLFRPSCEDASFLSRL